MFFIFNHREGPDFLSKVPIYRFIFLAQQNKNMIFPTADSIVTQIYGLKLNTGFFWSYMIFENKKFRI